MNRSFIQAPLVYANCNRSQTPHNSLSHCPYHITSYHYVRPPKLAPLSPTKHKPSNISLTSAHHKQQQVTNKSVPNPYATPFQKAPSVVGRDTVS